MTGRHRNLSAHRRGLVDRVMDELLSEDDRFAPYGWAATIAAVGYVGVHVAIWIAKGGVGIVR